MGLLYDDFSKEKHTWKNLEQDLKQALAAANESLDGRVLTPLRTKRLCGYEYKILFPLALLRQYIQFMAIKKN